MAGAHLEVNTTCTNSGIKAAKIKMQGKVKRLTYLESGLDHPSDRLRVLLDTRHGGKGNSGYRLGNSLAAVERHVLGPIQITDCLRTESGTGQQHRNMVAKEGGGASRPEKGRRTAKSSPFPKTAGEFQSARGQPERPPRFALPCWQQSRPPGSRRPTPKMPGAGQCRHR